MTDMQPGGDRPGPTAPGLPPTPTAVPEPPPAAPTGPAAAPPSAPGPVPMAPPPQPAWQPPPASPRQPGVPGAPGYYFAATVTRVAALLLDSILVGIVGGVIGGIVGGVAGAAASGTSSTSIRLVGGLTGLVVSFLYFGLLWRSSGKATVGQRLFRMQVGNAFDGAILTWQQVAIRWIVLFGFGILAALPVIGALGGLAGLVWAIVLLVTTATSLTKQGLHDRWADSAVVATGPQNTALAWGCLIAYVVVAAVLVILAFAVLVAFFVGASTLH